MAFRLSDLNAVTSSVSTDIFHLRTTAGLDKKITNTDLFNSIPTITVLGNSTLASGSGQFLVGEASALKSGSKAEIIGGGNYVLLLSSSKTNVTTKNTRIVGGHYTNSEEPVAMAEMVSTPSVNLLRIGGGHAAGNAATAISFFTGINTTTLTGSEAGRIDSSGRLLWGTTAQLGGLVNISSSQETSFISVSSLAANRLKLAASATTVEETFTRVGDDLRVLALGGNVLIGTTSSYGERFVVGNGGARFVGTLGDTIVPANGAELNFTRNSVNWISAITSGGYFGVVTNGRANGVNNANWLFNADLTNTSRGDIILDNGAVDGAGIRFLSEGNTTLNIDNSSGNLRFFESGATHMQLRSSSGELWLGYTADQGDYLLQVNGAALVNGGAKFNDSISLRYDFKSASVSESVLFTELFSWIQTNNDRLSIFGELQLGGSNYRILAAYQTSSTVLWLSAVLINNLSPTLTTLVIQSSGSNTYTRVDLMGNKLGN